MGRSRRYPKYDKLVKHDTLWAATNAKQRLAIVKKIDADSVPAAYCKSIKISVIDNSSESDNLAYAFYASYDDDTVFTGKRIIDHVVISPGGGTGYLNINRKIWKNTSQEDGVGSPISIWGECSDVVDTTTYTMTCFATRAIFEDL